MEMSGDVSCLFSLAKAIHDPLPVVIFGFGSLQWRQMAQHRRRTLGKSV